MKTIHTWVALVLFFTLFVKLEAQICPGEPGRVEWHAWNDLYDDAFSELTVLPQYPNSPDVIKPLFKLKSPFNYNNYFGSRVEGFIKVDTTTTATFNVTGNKYVQFYLSTDDDPDNKNLIAFLPDEVEEEEHGQYSEQTSVPIILTAGVNYYFEIVHVDNWGYDHFAIWWKTHLEDPNVWKVINANYIYGVDCKEPQCPDPETPCDDGDATTVDDIEDGHCNCFGSKITTDTCVGERGKLVSYRYDNIIGSQLNDLYEAEIFPGMPDYSEQYDYFGKRISYDIDDVGYTLQAYLTVPVSGNYKFNVTGDDYSILFLSSDNTFENRQAHQMIVTGYTGMTDHEEYIYQSSSNIFLEKGKYYYMEINQKQGGGGSHFSAFWQTPFTESGIWKRIPSLYFYDYKCELACISDGSACDDGNPFTNNDVYTDCECSGQPCSGPDCDSPIANYVAFDECGLTDQLDNNEDNNWLSCSTSPNPNSIRGVGHWIQYDLSERHELLGTQIWNYNVLNETNQGMLNVAVDYSEDGVSWTELNTYNWPQATGTAGDGGFTGPNFGGARARYVLITSLDAGSSCRGIGKVAFTAVRCPVSGTVCNDNDPQSFNDVFNNNCECIGSPLNVNDCGETVINLGDTTLNTSKFSATQEINSISKISSNSTVSFVAGQSVTLNVGFETNGPTLFLASIDPCDNSSTRSRSIAVREQVREQKIQEEAEDKLNELTVKDLGNGEIVISYYIKKAGKAILTINDTNGKVLYTLLDHKFVNPAVYKKRFRTKKLGNGSYNVKLQTAEKPLARKMIIAD